MLLINIVCLKNKTSPGQAHHLNQDAVYKGIIPNKDGVSTKLKGNAFKDVGTPHYNAHNNLEKFWDQYRKGGEKAGQRPTNFEYSKAPVDSMKASGKTQQEAMQLARAATKQRV
jgi:hypothetical protein